MPTSQKKKFFFCGKTAYISKMNGTDNVNIESIQPKKERIKFLLKKPFVKERMLEKRKSFVKRLKCLTWDKLQGSDWLEEIKRYCSGDVDIDLILYAIKAPQQFYDQAKSVKEQVKLHIPENYKKDTDIITVGCTANEVALKCSDVVIYITFEEDLMGVKNLQELYSKMEDGLKSLPDTFIQVQKTDSIYLELQFKFSNQSFILHFSENIEQHHSAVIADFLSLGDKVKQLIILIRFWMKRCVEVTYNPNRVRSCMVCFLVLFYFQQEYGVDPICDAIDFGKACVGGWDCAVIDYLKTFDKSFLDDMSVINLLRGFFKFYSDFDFESWVICPYIGEPLLKSCIHNGNYLPYEYAGYKDDLTLEPNLKSDFTSTLCIQDPFYHRNNMTKNLDKKVVLNIIKAFKNASKIFEEGGDVLYKLFTSKSH